VPTQNLEKRGKHWSFGIGRRSVACVLTLMYAVVSVVVCRFRSRTELELKIVAIRRQLSVLRRQRPGRPRLSAIDRLLPNH
jgi:hypothetical protein